VFHNGVMISGLLTESLEKSERFFPRFVNNCVFFLVYFDFG